MKLSSPINRIPLLYLLLYERLILKYGKMPRQIKLKDIITSNKIMLFHVANKYNYPIVQEMVAFKLLTKVNTNLYELVTEDYEKLTESIHTYFLWD